MKAKVQNDVESLRKSVQSLTVELLTRYEELCLLYSLGPQLGRLASIDEIASVALREAMDVLTADCGWVVFWEGKRQRVPEGCRRNIEAVTVEHINGVIFDALKRQGKSQFLSHDLSREYSLEGIGVPARLLASCLSMGELSGGYLCLGRHRDGPVFTSADQKLVNAVASFTAVELENVRLRRSELEKQRLAGELELARQIQQSLLPNDFTCVRFVEASGFSEPCFEVGGDYFDLIPAGANTCLLVMADVAGKGPPAALQAALVQGVVHGSSRHSLETSWLMTTLNQCIMARAGGSRLVTAFLASLDYEGRLHYTNAGHNPPLLIQRTGQVIELSQGNMLMGFANTTKYGKNSMQLAPGDTLVLYTDGVTDTMNEHDETFGMPRLLEWAGDQAGKSASEVRESLTHSLKLFSGRTRQADDLSVLIACYTGSHDSAML